MGRWWLVSICAIGLVVSTRSFGQTRPLAQNIVLAQNFHADDDPQDFDDTPQASPEAEPAYQVRETPRTLTSLDDLDEPDQSDSPDSGVLPASRNPTRNPAIVRSSTTAPNPQQAQEPTIPQRMPVPVPPPLVV